MPIYEYQCQSCQHVDEVWAKISDPAPEKCSACQKGPMTKLMSATSFVLNGSGWYKSGGTCPAKSSDKAEAVPAACPAVSGHGGGCGCCH
jgi:putative FmdB family regulatory protein